MEGGFDAGDPVDLCAPDGRVIADVVRLDKGHTEGLEPRITEELIKLMVSAPGGKLRTGETRLGADTVPG